ncbi:copper chaperone PCu(A)C [Rhodobacteraceae bacterium KMM 6894]|nr:copper chaperone PCu(A)C [Rhodobacteraceae bacterium KMM 6894]
MSFTFRTFAAVAAFAFATPVFAADLMVHDAYARSASPAAKTGAAFMQIMNHGADDRLISVASPAAKLVQLHTHEQDVNGVMSMIHVKEGFALPAGETLTMARGGKHVMLMGLTAPLEQGDIVPITLTFEKAGDMTVDVIVDLERQADEGAAHDHTMMDGEKKAD